MGLFRDNEPIIQMEHNMVKNLNQVICDVTAGAWGKKF